MRSMKKTVVVAFKSMKTGMALAALLLGVLMLFPLSTQAGFWDQALNFGQNILATAAGNYTNNYQQDLSQLLQAIRQPGTTNQPFSQGITQGITPGNPYNPNATQNESNPQYGGYEQNPGGYLHNPQYDDSSQGQGDNDPYNSQQGYPAQPDAGEYHSANSNPYAQHQGGNSPDAVNPGNPGYPPQQGGYDPYQDSGPQRPYNPQYGQPQYQPPTQPQYPNEPFTQRPNDLHPGFEQGIQLDVAIVKKTEMNGTETMIPINDGDVLKDGRGKAQAGDKFRIMFRTNSDCYVYVIAIDGSAWAQGVFPRLTAPFANPVKQSQQYIIPENNNWLSLDQFKGIETIFFVASPHKRQDIEDILATITGKERHPKATPQQVTEAPIIPAGFHRSQPSSTPFTIGQKSSSLQGQDQGLIPTTYFTQKAGEALRVTRWFRHE